MFLPNIIRIDPCNFELYRFKVDAFLIHKNRLISALAVSCKLYSVSLVYQSLSSIESMVGDQLISISRPIIILWLHITLLGE